jgi:hypothetical protein
MGLKDLAIVATMLIADITLYFGILKGLAID